MAALNLALAATVRAGERVLVHTPAWPNGASAARLHGAEIIALPLTALADGRFRLDLDRLASLLPGTRAFLLNSPNNPTGWTATHDELAAKTAPGSSRTKSTRASPTTAAKPPPRSSTSPPRTTARSSATASAKPGS